MKKEHILIPEPNSKFLKISCKECEKKSMKDGVRIRKFELVAK